jgi:hypothetical protein
MPPRIPKLPYYAPPVDPAGSVLRGLLTGWDFNYRDAAEARATAQEARRAQLEEALLESRKRAEADVVQGQQGLEAFFTALQGAPAPLDTSTLPAGVSNLPLGGGAAPPTRPARSSAELLQRVSPQMLARVARQYPGVYSNVLQEGRMGEERAYQAQERARVATERDARRGYLERMLSEAREQGDVAGARRAEALLAGVEPGKPAEGFTLTPQARRYDAMGRLIAEGAPEAPKPPEGFTLGPDQARWDPVNQTWITSPIPRREPERPSPGFTLGPDQARYDPETNTWITSPIPRTDKPDQVTSTAEAAYRHAIKAGPEGSPQYRAAYQEFIRGTHALPTEREPSGPTVLAHRAALAAGHAEGSPGYTTFVQDYLQHHQTGGAAAIKTLEAQAIRIAEATFPQDPIRQRALSERLQGRLRTLGPDTPLAAIEKSIRDEIAAATGGQPIPAPVQKATRGLFGSIADWLLGSSPPPSPISGVPEGRPPSLGGERQGGPLPARPSAGGTTFTAPPDPSAYTGRTIRNPTTGERLRSDGTRWLPVP